MNGRPPDPRGEQRPGQVPGCQFVRDNLEGFALGALDVADRDAVERHLRRCPECRDDADVLERVAGLLPLVLPASKPPPAGSFASIVDRIAAEDEDRVPAVSSGGARHASVIPGPVVPRKPARRGLVPAAIIAPLAIALVVVGAWANSLRNDLDDAEGAMSTQIALGQTALAGDEMMMFAVESPEGRASAGGQIGLSESGLMGMAVAWNMDPETDLEVWGVTHGGKRMKVCELKVDPTGAVMQTFSLPERPSSLRELYISNDSGEMMYMLRPQPEPEGTPGPPDEQTATT